MMGWQESAGCIYGVQAFSPPFHLLSLSKLGLSPIVVPAISSRPHSHAPAHKVVSPSFDISRVPLSLRPRNFQSLAYLHRRQPETRYNEVSRTRCPGRLGLGHRPGRHRQNRAHSPGPAWLQTHRQRQVRDRHRGVEQQVEEGSCYQGTWGRQQTDPWASQP